MSRYGLIGQSLKHSFSSRYFTEFFQQEELPHSYSNYEIETVDGLIDFIQCEQISGLNVTIPFKEAVLPILDEIDHIAKEIGAVNVIKVDNGKLIGYNTDVIGFWKSLRPALSNKKIHALLVGTGGASRAILHALRDNGIQSLQVSRRSHPSVINYQQLTPEIVRDHQLIINCTPLGTFPDIEDKVDIPYDGIESEHILYDVVYNPLETSFLKEGKSRNAKTINGSKMLRIQAEESWKIWNK